MGQRLNVEIMNKGDPLCNCYMHWSAYTGSALYITKELIENYNLLKSSITDPLLLAVRMLEKITNVSCITGETTYAGVCENSLVFLKEKYPGEEFNIATDRNAGFISVVEDEMEDTRKWEEGRVEIDIGDKTINFEVGYYMDIHEFIEEMTDCEMDYDFSNMPITTLDFGALPFSKIDIFIDLLKLSSDILILSKNCVEIFSSIE